jgi:histidyl-tRNA synthetase
LSLKGKSSSFLRNVKASFPKASRDFKSNLDDLLNVTALMDNLGCSYEIDIAAMHGFEYYTGVCFRFMAGGEKIGGGGRYDRLVPLMNGENAPACGFALYVDPMMRLLPPEKEKEAKSGILIKGKEWTPEIVGACFAVAESLRDTGHVAELDFTGRRESDYEWVVTISGREPFRFVLKGRLQKRRREVSSVAGILEVVNRR